MHVEVLPYLLLGLAIIILAARLRLRRRRIPRHTFLASQSLLRIVFPNWRYRGGQWLF